MRLMARPYFDYLQAIKFRNRFFISILRGMSRYYSYLNSATAILSTYKGEEPFASFIKKYFSQHKKFGSKDRKQVSHLCYCYFRIGKAIVDLPVEERILIALFLCAHHSHEVLHELRPEWDDKVSLSFDQKIKLIGYKFFIDDIFSWQDELSDDCEKDAFILSHLEQPELFLRLRPGKEKVVKQKLTTGGIGFQTISGNCIAITNSSKINELMELDREAVVQDYSSQQVGALMAIAGQQLAGQPSIRVWDCCAASGGKSIMAKDILGDIDLIVSDVRRSILINLEDRFARAGIKNYEKFIADLGKPLSISLSTFNLIIADVPCTGSGTWGRTPEQLLYFDPAQITLYADLQKRIVSSALAQLEPGGYLLYITCSVFKMENEAIIEFIKEKFHLQEVKIPARMTRSDGELLKGYDRKADTMFAALLGKPL